MKLVLHQFKLEIRRSRLGLFLYLLILVCNFPVAMGWIGAPKLQLGHWIQGSPLPMIFAIAYWIGFAMVICNCVLADSPIRRDRFLSTRPLPAAKLVGAKVLYIAVAAILPIAALETVVAVITTGNATTSVLSGVERFLFASCIALPIATFAAHWKNTQGFLTAAAIIFGGGLMLGRPVVELLLKIFDRDSLQLLEPTLLCWMQGLMVTGLALALTASLFSRHGRRWSILAPSFILIAFAGGTVLLKTPLRATPLATTNQKLLDDVVANGAGLRVFPRGYSIREREQSPALQAHYALTPILPGVPEDLEMRWSALDEQWSVDGKRVHRDGRNPNLLASQFVSAEAVPISWSLAQAVQSHVGETVLFHVEKHRLHHGPSIVSQSLDYDHDDRTIGKDATLRTRLVGDAIRWKVLADLPLEENATGGPRGNSWRIHALQGRQSLLELKVGQSALSLHLFGGSNERNSPRHWGGNYSFIAYLPQEKEALIGYPQGTRVIPNTSACKHLFGDILIRSGGNQDFTPQSLAHARLLILAPEHIGRIRHEWDSPSFSLSAGGTDRRNPPRDYGDGQLSPAQFAQWFHTLDKLAPDRDATAVREHLETIFQCVDRVPHAVANPGDPAVIYAARFVPRHLDFMLESLPGLTPNQTQFLVAVIKRGARADQRGQLVDALRHTHELFEAVVARGWDEAAMNALVTLTKENRNANHRYFHELIAMNSSELDEFILDSYRMDSPSRTTYDLLRSVPRLATRVEAITDGFWRPGLLVISSNGPEGLLHLALARGNRDALEEFYLMLNSVPQSRQYDSHFSGQIKSAFRVPAHLRKHGANRAEIIAWAKQFKPEDFVYDPFFRQFVPKASNPSI